NGSAPLWAGHMNRFGVPAGGILLTGAVAFLGVILNYWVPSKAFEIVLNVSAIGIIVGCAAITMPHQKFVALAKKGLYQRPEYRAPLASYTNWLTMLFLTGVLVLIGFDYPVGPWTLASMAIVIPLLIGGWFLC